MSSSRRPPPPSTPHPASLPRCRCVCGGRVPALPTLCVCVRGGVCALLPPAPQTDNLTLPSHPPPQAVSEAAASVCSGGSVQAAARAAANVRACSLGRGCLCLPRRHPPLTGHATPLPPADKCDAGHCRGHRHCRRQRHRDRANHGERVRVWDRDRDLHCCGHRSRPGGGHMCVRVHGSRGSTHTLTSLLLTHPFPPSQPSRLPAAHAPRRLPLPTLKPSRPTSRRRQSQSALPHAPRAGPQPPPRPPAWPKRRQW